MAKWGMVIDLEKCTGCQACTTACAMEHSRLPGENWQDVLFYHEGTYPNVKLQWFPRPCMHCENASCVDVCPTRATYKDPNGGYVLIDWNKCIGCKACMVACPYGVRFYTDERATVQPDLRSVFPAKNGRQWEPPYKGPQDDPTRGVGIAPPGVVTKCTFCYHKTSTAPKGVADLDEANPATKEHTPACVRMCPPKARWFGDLDNPASKVNKLIADKRGVRLLDQSGNKPQVYYLSGGTGAAVPSSRANETKA